jgi:hypothetical protein
MPRPPCSSTTRILKQPAGAPCSARVSGQAKSRASSTGTHARDSLPPITSQPPGKQNRSFLAVSSTRTVAVNQKLPLSSRSSPRHSYLPLNLSRIRANFSTLRASTSSICSRTRAGQYPPNQSGLRKMGGMLGLWPGHTHPLLSEPRKSLRHHGKRERITRPRPATAAGRDASGKSRWKQFDPQEGGTR